MGDFVNYSVKTTNLTKDTLNVVKLIYDDQKVIAPGKPTQLCRHNHFILNSKWHFEHCITTHLGELGIIDNLLSNESCVILLNDHISLDTVPQEVKSLLK